MRYIIYISFKLCKIIRYSTMETNRTGGGCRSKVANAKIDEIRKNIFSIYAKEFDLKHKVAVDTGNKDKCINDTSEHTESVTGVSTCNTNDVTNNPKAVSCPDDDTGLEQTNNTESPVTCKEQGSAEDQVRENPGSPNREQSPVRVNSTSFSVADILDPGKFTGQKSSWHPWLQRECREMRDDSDDDCMIDDSGKPGFLLFSLIEYRLISVSILTNQISLFPLKGCSVVFLIFIQP